MEKVLLKPGDMAASIQCRCARPLVDLPAACQQDFQPEGLSLTSLKNHGGIQQTAVVKAAFILVAERPVTEPPMALTCPHALLSATTAQTQLLSTRHIGIDSKARPTWPSTCFQAEGHSRAPQVWRIMGESSTPQVVKQAPHERRLAGVHVAQHHQV